MPQSTHEQEMARLLHEREKLAKESEELERKLVEIKARALGVIDDRSIIKGADVKFPESS